MAVSRSMAPPHPAASAPPLGATGALGAPTTGLPPAHRVDSFEVGWLFVQEYYTFLNKDPARLHCFYNKKSFFLHGAEGEKAKLCHGGQEIHDRIMELEFQGCKVLVSNVDSQASLNNGIVVQVLGEMSNKGGPSHKFCQTFFLAEQPNGYYVLNDVFRFLKEDIDHDYDDEGSPLPVPSASGPAASASGHAPSASGPALASSLTSSPIPGTTGAVSQPNGTPAARGPSVLPAAQSPARPSAQSPSQSQRFPSVASSSSAAVRDPSPARSRGSPERPEASARPTASPAPLQEPAGPVESLKDVPRSWAPPASSPNRWTAQAPTPAESLPLRSTSPARAPGQAPPASQVSAPAPPAAFSESASSVWGHTQSPAAALGSGVSGVVTSPGRSQPVPAPSSSAAAAAPAQSSAGVPSPPGPVIPSAPHAAMASETLTGKETSLPPPESSKPKSWASLAAQNSSLPAAPLPAKPLPVAVSVAPLSPPPREPHRPARENRNMVRDEDPPVSIIVKYVTHDISETALRDAFLAYGPIKNIDVHYNKGIAFVDFVSTESAQKAFDQDVNVEGIMVRAEEKLRRVNGKGPRKDRSFADSDSSAYHSRAASNASGPPTGSRGGYGGRGRGRGGGRGGFIKQEPPRQ